MDFHMMIQVFKQLEGADCMISHLDLSDNTFDDMCLRNLQESLLKNSSLTSLNISAAPSMNSSVTSE